MEHGTEPLPDVVAATVTWRASSEQILTAEIEGQMFVPARDQAEEQRAVRIRNLRETIASLAGEQRGEVTRLLDEYDGLWRDRAIDAREYVLRQVGIALCENRLADLWRLLYARLGSSDDRYRPQAAGHFLSEVTDFDRGSSW